MEYVQKNAEKFRLGEKAEFVSEIITSRGKVYFEKIDKRTKGIDFIKVYVPVVSKQTEPDNKKIIEAYKRDRKQILGTVIKRIKETKRFQNLGVPINIFKLSNVTLTEQRELYFLFELKDELIQYSAITSVFEWFIGNMEGHEEYSITYQDSEYELVMRRKEVQK